MKRTLLSLAALIAAMPALAQTPAADNQDISICKQSGLVALQSKSPDIQDIKLDMDSVTVNPVNKKVEDTTVRAVVEGDAYIERAASEKPHRLLCLLGENDKVLMTFFTEH